MSVLLRSFAALALTAVSAAAQTPPAAQAPQAPASRQQPAQQPTPLGQPTPLSPPAILPPPQAAPNVQGGALNADQSAIVRRANDNLNGMAELSGDFLQINPNGDQVVGKFFLSRPGKVRFDYARPSSLELISDGTTVAVRDRKTNTQDLYYLTQTPLKMILAEKVDLTKDAKIVSVMQQLELSTIVIEEKSALANGRLSLVFEGPGFDLRQWTITDAQGLNTTVAIQNVEKSTAKLNPETFKIRYNP